MVFENASMARYCRYLTGTLGLEIIKGIADHMAGKLSATSHLAQIYDRLLPLVLENGYQKIGDDEILNGRAGFLAGVLQFKFVVLNLKPSNIFEINLKILLQALDGTFYIERPTNFIGSPGHNLFWT